MASEEFRDWVFHGREERNLEYKPSLNWKDDTTKAKIAKAVLAMANLRDGGFIVLGVEDSGAKPTGMNQRDSESFNQDHVLAHVNEYADPFVELAVSPVELEGKLFVVIRVQEFYEIPVICKKETKDQNLRKGAIYIRSRRIPESAEVRSQTEMREILELAAIKNVRKLISTMESVGIQIGVQSDNIDDDRRQYNDQRGEL